MATSYDHVPYPSSVFIQTHPERLAVLGQLAGLEPAPPHTARILEIGGGDCLNLLSFAAMWPNCEAHGFDLSEIAIARGVRIARGAALENVALMVDDIMTAHRNYPARSFDYVIVHGVYAWVPDAVRDACMALVAHVLSDRGIAMISYNAMPGGHVRLIMREMLLDVVGEITGFEERVAATREFLEDYAKPLDDDETMVTALRQQATSMLQRPDSVLFHDELGDHYHPQRMADVVTFAASLGLRFLTDAGRNRHLDGFLSDANAQEEDCDTAVLLAASREDYRVMRYFRHSLFVRDHQPVDRNLEPGRLSSLYLTTRLRRQPDGSFKSGDDEITIADTALADALEQAAARAPERIAIRDITTDPDQLHVIAQLFAQWYVTLHIGPAPFPLEPGDRPTTSALVRALLEMGELTVCTLDHSLLKIEQGELRALLLSADGTRTIADIATFDHGIPGEEVLAALTASARRGLLSA